MTNEELVKIYENRILEHIKVAVELTKALPDKFKEVNLEDLRNAIEDVEHEFSGIKNEMWMLKTADDNDD